MLCILCVNFPEQIIDIFSEEGLNLNVCGVIGKHFWMQPNKNDENARYICGSCWNALHAFHKFYKQIEEAHLALLTATPVQEEDLKPDDNQMSVEVEVRLIDTFDENGDYTNTDVKLELKDDGEVCLPSIEPASDMDINNIDDNEDDKPDQATIDSSDDSDDSELPLANISKTRSKEIIKTTSSNEDADSLGEWHHNEDDDDDDDDDENDDVDDDEDSVYEEKHKKASTIKPRTGKKRGRPPGRRNSSRLATPKELTIEQITKKQLSKQYDDIIQKNMKLVCNICQLSLTNFFTLKKHYRCKHKERGYVVCCSKKFLKRGVLVDHIYTHLNPEHFKCDKCDKVLADRRCLEVHMNVHNEGKNRIYQCDQCNKSFFKKPLLTRHMHIHIPDEERKFQCEECNKFFPSNYTLRAHTNNVHQNAYAKICDQCGKSIRGREAFQRHLLEHAGVPIPIVQCDKCGAKLKNKYGLKRHMNAMHTESSVPHVCNICGKVAPNAPALQRHHHYVHKAERNHKCPMCDKAFKKPAGLKEHMTTHTGEVLYTCPHCPKTFNSNANMHSHRKKMHRKEWEENRRHPHLGTSANAKANAEAAAAAAAAAAAEENNQQ